MHTFQAVLLIGGTSPNLHPLTATGTPKALLPVANEPLVSFPLKALEDSGVEDVIAVTRIRCALLCLCLLHLSWFPTNIRPLLLAGVCWRHCCREGIVLGGKEVLSQAASEGPLVIAACQGAPDDQGNWSMY